MSLALVNLVSNGLDTMFKLGNQFVKASTYFRPASFNPANGQTVTLEQSVPVTAFVATYRPRELGLVSFQPGDEKVYIRASELTAITDPVTGDYVIENVSGLRRDVISARLDSSGKLWTFQTQRGYNYDFGAVADAFGSSDDYGDLTAATAFDDFGSVV